MTVKDIPERIWIQNDLSFFQTTGNGTYYRDPDSNSIAYVPESQVEGLRDIIDRQRQLITRQEDINNELRANHAAEKEKVWDAAIEAVKAERHGKALHQEWSQVHHDTVDRIIAALQAARTADINNEE